MNLKLTAPKVASWWIAIALGVLGVLGKLGTVAALAPYAFWLVVGSAGLLLAATLLKDL